jgi:serine protease Do
MRTFRKQTILAGAQHKLILIALVFSMLVYGGQSSAWAKTDVPKDRAATVVSSYADIVSRVAPAVVTIHSEGHARAAQQPLMDDPTLRQFFGNRMPRSQQEEPARRRSALGSGVIVSADGYILTNYHVISEAEQVKVELTDNRTFDAKVIGSDKLSDLAVLKINSSNLPVLPLGDSDRMRVGDVVLAIGNPLGVGQTVTSGIISAKGRSTGLSDGGFEDFIQTDAAINQGNSGGALVNTNGELIGINSQILSPSGGSIGIGFSIPSNMAESVMEQLVKTGKVMRSKLGVGIQPVTSDIAASLELSQVRGVIVTSVEPGSPAANAGIRQGDVITGFNGSPVTDSNSLRNQVARTQPGSDAVVSIFRDGREQQLKATVTELVADKKEPVAANNDTRQDSNGGKLGLTVEPLTPALASQLGLEEKTSGLVVASIDPAGPAADAGLRRGDVIQQIDRKPVSSVADLTNEVSSNHTKPMLLLISRQGQVAYLTVRPRQ